jgi:hypothetical protein
MFLSFLKEGMLFRERMWYLWHLIIWPYFAEKTMLGYFLFQKLGINTRVRTLSDDAIVEMAEWHTEWLFEEKSIVSDQKFDRIGDLCGPSDSLNNTCFRQFRMAEEFAFLYGNDKNEAYLNTLLAWLYLPKSVQDLDANDKEYRLTLSASEVKKRADFIGGFDIEIRYYLYLWYLSAKSGIVKRFDVVFEPTATKKTIQTKKPLENLRQSFSSMLVMRAEHVTKLEDTDFAPLFDVLQFFKSEILQARHATK